MIQHKKNLLGFALCAAWLSACGGGGESPSWVGNGGSVSSSGGGVTAQRCAPNNPYRAQASSPTSLGTLADEKRWVRDYMERAYLWYRDIPAVNATASNFSNERDVYGSLEAYFAALKSPQFTASGKRKDEFSFTYPSREWQALSQSGSVLGYGIEWHFDSRTAPRGIKVAYVEPNSPAAQQGVQRGDLLLSADGLSVDVTAENDVDLLNAALFPSAGTHGFVFSRAGVVQPTLNLTATQVSKQPVLVSKTLALGGDKVGYLLFNDHIASAETPLINAFSQFQAEGVSDLVLDLRYNGGGYLYLAAEVAYMIAGPARTQGKLFEQLQYNDKRQADTANGATPFYNTACLLDSRYNCTSSQPLPSLNLPRVYVLTTDATCSASEAIINGLRGVDVDVQIIGSTSCGKPYGFTAQDNCGISYFPIEFVGSNAKGFGDYADGFAPSCATGDDFATALGDSKEGMLAAALYKRTHGVCQPVSAARRIAGSGAVEGFLLRPPVRENRILLPR